MSETHRKGEPFRETLWVIFHSKLTFLVFIAWACCLFRWKSSPCSQKPFSRPTSSRLFIWRSSNSSLSFGWWKLRVSLNFHLKESQRCLLLAIRYDPKFWDFERSKHRNEEVIWNRLLENAGNDQTFISIVQVLFWPFYSCLFTQWSPVHPFGSSPPRVLVKALIWFVYKFCSFCCEFVLDFHSLCDVLSLDDNHQKGD